MSNSEIFLTPGTLITSFFLSLVDMTPAQVHPLFYHMMVILISLFVWMKFIRMCVAIVKRAFGFDMRGRS